MTIPARLFRHRLPLVVALACLASLVSPRSTMGQAKPSNREGIDLILLVDVSGSMASVPGTTYGNDREHIRWDAVLLATNLLTAEDRVVIFPFNGTVPAVHSGAKDVFIPGKMPEFFHKARSHEVEAIREQVRTFVHGNQPNQGIVIKNGIKEWNGDEGGTAILMAVERARNLLKQDRPDGPGRHRFVILLTDGVELAGTEKPHGLEFLRDLSQPLRNLSGFEDKPEFKQWLDKVSVDLSESDASIYTIGLGNNSDLPLLQQIARSTNGSNQYVSNNGALIDTFRNLIWQLKGSWTKTLTILPASPSRGEDDLLDEIRDVGVLAYKTVPRRNARTYEALKGGEDFTFAWLDRAGAALDVAALEFRAPEESYTYVHYDRANFPGGSKATDHLLTSWNLAPSNRHIHFSKRTKKPLFTITPFGKNPLPRFKPLAVLVEMEPNSGFEPDWFDLDVMLRKSASPDQPAKDLFTKPIPLTYQPSQAGFACNVDLSILESSGNKNDDYTLVVTAKGKPLEQNFSLRNYTLTLPPIDVRVDSRLMLKPVGLVKFSNENLKQAPIKIRPEGSAARAVPGARPLDFRVEIDPPPVDSSGRPLQLVKFTRTVRLAANPSGELEGSIDVELPNDAAKGHYTKGKFQVSAADPLYPKMANPLSIEFEVSITTLKVSLNRREIPLKYESGQPEASKVLQFEVPGKVRQKLTVVIPESAEMGGFGPGELWLEKARGTGPAKDRTQKLEIDAPAETFQIFFQPNAAHERGFYQVQLEVKGVHPSYEYDSGQGVVSLNFQAPVIVPSPPETIPIQRGTSLVKELKFGLQGGTPIAREVGFRCVAPRSQSAESPIFNWEGKADSQTMILLEPLDTAQIKSSPAATPGSVWIKIAVSPDAECGTYTLQRGQLWADRTESQPVTLAVEVNDLEVIGLDGPTNHKELAFLQLKGKPLVRTFQVFAAKGDLDPNEVEVSEEGPFVNESTFIENPGLKPRTVSRGTCKHPKDGRAGVQFGLAFPDLDVSFEQYSGKLEIRCKQPRLTRLVDCVVQRVELSRVKKGPAGK